MNCIIRTPEERISIPCQPEQTILDAILDAGWEVPYSCRNGVCESCRAQLVSGEVSPAPNADGSALLCCSFALGDIEISPKEIKKSTQEKRRITTQVYRIKWAASDVAVIDLRFPAGIKVPFKAGQYLQVLLDDERPRFFSMANPSRQNDGVQIHVRIIPGGVFGTQVLPGLNKGDSLEIELPFGDFNLREESSRPVLFVAGGTGFAPIHSILESVLARQKDREFILYWGAKSPEGIYLLDQIKKWQSRYSHFHFVPVISDAFDNQGMRTGLVHEAVMEDYTTLAHHDVYVCGSPGLVQAAKNSFTLEKELPEQQFFADMFITPADIAMME